MDGTRRPRLISFDAAGTLIHVREPVGETYAKVARAHGVKVDVIALHAAFKKAWVETPQPHHITGPAPDDDRGWWRAFAEEVFATAMRERLAEEVFAPLFDELYEHYAKAEAWGVFEDVTPALGALRGEIDLCVLSNFDGRLRRILAGHGLADHFQHVILSSEVGVSKPDARMFEAAEEAHGVRADECVHVGDDARCDVEGAEARGWRAYQVMRPEAGLMEFVEKLRRG